MRRTLMQDGKGLTNGLAIVGTVLLWLPFALMAVSMPGPIRSGGLFEFLAIGAMELFPAVLLGGGLLMWAAARARSHRRVIGWSLAVPAASLVTGMALSGVMLSVGGPMWSVTWPGAVIEASLAPVSIVYWLGLTAAAVAGVSLVRALLIRPRPEGDLSTVRG
jgi:hypothetical protein